MAYNTIPSAGVHDWCQQQCCDQQNASSAQEQVPPVADSLGGRCECL